MRSGSRWVQMRSLGDLVIALLDELSLEMHDAAAGTSVEVTGVDVDLPLETRLGRGGEMRASLPRGRFATGFQLPHGRLKLRYETAVAPPPAGAKP